MGRRQKSHPTKCPTDDAEEGDADVQQPSTSSSHQNGGSTATDHHQPRKSGLNHGLGSSNGLTATINGGSTPNKRFSDFSISSQLEEAPAAKKKAAGASVTHQQARPSTSTSTSTSTSIDPFSQLFTSPLIGGGSGEGYDSSAMNMSAAMAMAAAMFSSMGGGSSSALFPPPAMWADPIASLRSMGGGGVLPSESATVENPLAKLSQQVDSFGQRRAVEGAEKKQKTASTSKRPSYTADTTADCAALDLSVKGSRSSQSNHHIHQHPHHTHNQSKHSSSSKSNGNGINGNGSSSKKNPPASTSTTNSNPLNMLSSLVSTMSANLPAESPFNFKGLFPDFSAAMANSIPSTSTSGTSVSDFYRQLMDGSSGSASRNNGAPGSTNDPSKIFTCLQCFGRYESMEQLVQHMEKTLHFNSFKFNGALPTTATSNASPSAAAPPTPARSSSSTPTLRKQNGGHHKSAASSRCGTFRFECMICGHSSDSAIDAHMTREHSFTCPSEWISAVKLIPLQ